MAKIHIPFHWGKTSRRRQPILITTHAQQSTTHSHGKSAPLSFEFLLRFSASSCELCRRRPHHRHRLVYGAQIQANLPPPPSISVGSWIESLRIIHSTDQGESSSKDLTVAVGRSRSKAKRPHCRKCKLLNGLTHSRGRQDATGVGGMRKDFPGKHTKRIIIFYLVRTEQAARDRAPHRST